MKERQSERERFAPILKMCISVSAGKEKEFFLKLKTIILFFKHHHTHKLVQQHKKKKKDAHFHLFMSVPGCAVCMHAYMKEKGKHFEDLNKHSGS